LSTKDSKFDLTRYGAVVKVAALLAVLWAVIGVGLTQTFTPPFPAPADWEQYNNYGRQLAGVQRQRDRKDPFPEHWGILLGSSTMWYGPLPAEVAEHTPGWKWLLLSIGDGGGALAFTRLSSYEKLLDASNLRPDTVVLGMHPFWMAEEIQIETTTPSLREVVSDAAYGWLQKQRESLFRKAGFGLPATFLPVASPWNPPTSFAWWSTKSGPQWLDSHLQQNARKGRFDPSRYQAGGPSALAMAQALADLQGLHARIVVVFLPERAQCRALVPPLADQLAAAVLQGHPVEVWDLRAALPDDAFLDSYHLTLPGRESLSALLGERLSQRQVP
jgi:hypothetical protein